VAFLAPAGGVRDAEAGGIANSKQGGVAAFPGQNSGNGMKEVKAETTVKSQNNRGFVL
jgi:hypothetical protein